MIKTLNKKSIFTLAKWILGKQLVEACQYNKAGNTKLILTSLCPSNVALLENAVATFLNRSIYTRSIIWGADSWQRTKNILITCYFEWYWNSSRLIVRFIFLLIKTENADAFSEKTKKKCCIIKKDLSVVREKFASINQKHYQDLGTERIPTVKGIVCIKTFWFGDWK